MRVKLDQQEKLVDKLQNQLEEKNHKIIHTENMVRDLELKIEQVRQQAQEEINKTSENSNNNGITNVQFEQKYADLQKQLKSQTENLLKQLSQYENNAKQIPKVSSNPIENELEKAKQTIGVLTQFVNDNEKMVKLQELQLDTLKEEIREMNRSQKRNELDVDYLKNIMVKYLTVPDPQVSYS